MVIPSTKVRDKVGGVTLGDVPLIINFNLLKAHLNQMEMR